MNPLCSSHSCLLWFSWERLLAQSEDFTQLNTSRVWNNLTGSKRCPCWNICEKLWSRPEWLLMLQMLHEEGFSRMPPLNANAVCLCESCRNLYIFHNEEKKAPDGKYNLVTFTYSHTGGDLSSVVCRLLSVRVCVCVVLLIYSQPQRKHLQHSTCSSNFLTEDMNVEIRRDMQTCSQHHYGALTKNARS